MDGRRGGGSVQSAGVHAVDVDDFSSSEDEHKDDDDGAFSFHSANDDQSVGSVEETQES